MISPALFVILFLISAALRLYWTRRGVMLTAWTLMGYRVTKSIVEICWAIFYAFVIWGSIDFLILQSISRFVFVLYLLNEAFWHGTITYVVWTRRSNHGPPG